MGALVSVRMPISRVLMFLAAALAAAALLGLGASYAGLQSVA